ncbi:MAG: EAL domain-containing protein [Rickettsiaceae bacterium]
MDLNVIKDIRANLSLFKSGYCFLIKLCNYQELQSMQYNLAEIMKSFSTIIKNNYVDFLIENSNFIMQDDLIFFFIKDIDDKSRQNLAFRIYRDSQLYTHSYLSALHLQCKIANVKYSDQCDAKRIYCELISLLCKNDKGKYYYECNSENGFVKDVVYCNQRLNLLRRAIIKDTLTFMFQPIIDSKTMKVHYYECLLRFPNESGELISIGEIIGDVESKGLINLIDQIVFKMVVDELNKSPNVHLSINISNVGILDPEFISLSEDLLKKNNVSDRLIIEITEHSLNDDYENTATFINKFHSKFNCRFALDDFGSGFTTFRQLQNLPIDLVKIDGSYISNIVNNNQSQYFVEILVKISEELGIKTVAEFVENGEIAKFLFDINIDNMQGNFFAPPLKNLKIEV